MGLSEWFETWKNRRKHRLKQASGRFFAWGSESAKKSLFLTLVVLIGGSVLYSAATGAPLLEAVLTNLPTTFGLGLSTLIFDVAVVGFLAVGLWGTYKAAKGGRLEQAVYVLFGLFVAVILLTVFFGWISVAELLP